MALVQISTWPCIGFLWCRWRARRKAGQCSRDRGEPLLKKLQNSKYKIIQQINSTDRLLQKVVILFLIRICLSIFRTLPYLSLCESGSGSECRDPYYHTSMVASLLNSILLNETKSPNVFFFIWQYDKRQQLLPTALAITRHRRALAQSCSTFAFSLFSFSHKQ
jgi:hypothetical protein